jgi:hypothetical protein
VRKQLAAERKKQRQERAAGERAARNGSPLKLVRIE